MWLLFVMVVGSKAAVPAPLKQVSELLQVLEFTPTKTELDKKSHWVKQTKVPAPTKIDSLVLKRPDGAELTAEQWAYPSAEAAIAAKTVLDRDVTNASWNDGAALVVITAAKPAYDAYLTALTSHHKDCTLAPPLVSLTSKIKDYKVKDRTLLSVSESGILPGGERVLISRSQCTNVSVSYRFFVEVPAADAMAKARELLVKLAEVARKPEDVSGLAKTLSKAALNADVKIGSFSSVRATYDDRGAEPTLSVEYVDAP
jgi:hypothetical protein